MEMNKKNKEGILFQTITLLKRRRRKKTIFFSALYSELDFNYHLL